MFVELFFWEQSMDVRNPNQARGWAGTKLASLSPEFFNRRDDGKTLCQTSPFSIGPCDGGVRIDAFGAEASGKLLQKAQSLNAEFLAQYPEGDFRIRTGIASVRETGDRLYSYALHDMVLENASSQKNLFTRMKEGKVSPEELNQIAEKLFREKLDERMALLDADFTEYAVFGDFVATPFRPCYSGDRPRYTVTLTFRANVIFNGPWYLGRLANKSCGRLHMVTKRERVA